MIIAIGGVSRAGKSSLAKEIVSLYPQFDIDVLCLDDFVIGKECMPVIKSHLDWEIPQMYDFKLFCEAVLESEKQHDIVIAEGILVFQESMLHLFDKKIFLRITKDTFSSLKQLDTRWGAEPDWYVDYIWTSYHKHGIPKFDETYLIIDNDNGHDVDAIVLFLNL
jgi:Uridine kinase